MGSTWKTTALVLAIGSVSLAWPTGCRESETVEPGEGDEDQGCPHACVSQLLCVQGDGIAHGELDCDEDGEICCELGAAGDSDSDSDSDSDTGPETDTGDEPCPYECMSIYQCYAVDGEEHPGYACEDPDDVCCEVEEDTDTGYKGAVFDCLICEPGSLRQPAFEPGAGVLELVLDLMSGR